MHGNSCTVTAEVALQYKQFVCARPWPLHITDAAVRFISDKCMMMVTGAHVLVCCVNCQC